MGFIAGKERRIFEWSQGARGHYERQRRAELIEKARSLVLQPSRGGVKIEVEVETQGAGVIDLTEEQTVDVKLEKKPKPESELEIEEDATAWDFDEGDEKKGEKKEETKAAQNEGGDWDGWGFEDEGGTDGTPTSSTDVVDDDPWAQDWSDPTEVKPPSPPPPKQLAASAQPSTPIQKKAKTMRKESYLVSQVAIALASIAEDIIQEGSELLDSRWVTSIPT
jgi:centromere/kinetochore protein ZW10